jgi:hypothetical protein
MQQQGWPTRETARKMLHRWAEDYGEPVLPLPCFRDASQVCAPAKSTPSRGGGGAPFLHNGQSNGEAMFCIRDCDDTGCEEGISRFRQFFAKRPGKGRPASR